MVAAAAVMLTFLGTACGGACDDAIALCEDCELEVVKADCEGRFDEASTEYCEQAVETYEQSCAAAQ